ncbi:MAG: HEAT repeat domain-containing protein [candidate division WOR-3 bacterium]|nr:MAG: HEAT repeat domain-containing protein [candidate division WOR-3 bacterium]
MKYEKTLIVMRRLIFLTACAACVMSQPLDNEVLEYLEKGLLGFGITLDELSFEKKWVDDDTFRLSVVADLMDNPLDIPSFVQEEGTMCAATDPLWLSQLIRHRASQLDIDPIEDDPLPRQRAAPTVMPTLQEQVNHSIMIMLGYCDEAASYLDRSIQQLTDHEIEQILVNAPIIWSDPDDTLEADSLKGMLYQELLLPYDTTTLETEQLLALIKKIDRTDMARAAYLLHRGAEEVIGSLAGFHHDTVYQGIILDTLSPHGRIVIGGYGQNHYDGDYALIIDLGGDDLYTGMPATGIGVLYDPFSVIIDLSGDDVYRSQRVCAIGAGVLGCGVLIDLEGNDVYRGFHNSIGAALLGAGSVVDLAGNDLYEAGYFCEGAGFVGLGMLYDAGGDDIFRGYCFAQGFGSTFGSGTLINIGGDDVYTAGSRYPHRPLLPQDHRSFAQGFAMGFRPDAGGGIGLLYDSDGNDFYNAEVFAQGTSYWYSLGMLIDMKGNDYYNAAEYAQGAGIHLSVGVLMDSAGNDHFFSRYGPSQGEGHDLAVGMLMDFGGDDSYVVSGGQGVGLNNSFGLLLDAGGNDTYATSEPIGQGSATVARGFGSIGTFIDLGGQDLYAGQQSGRDENMWQNGDYGIGIDLESARTPRQATYTQRDTLPDDATIERLFEAAAEWAVAENIERVEHARERMKDRYQEAIQYVITHKMGTTSGLERRALEDLAKVHSDSIEPMLTELLYDHDIKVRKNAIWLLGVIGASCAVAPLIEALEQAENEPIKTTIVFSLGDIGDARAVPQVIHNLEYGHEKMKIIAAQALGKIKDTSAISALIHSLSHKMFTVRSASENSIVAIADPAITPLLTVLKSSDDHRILYHAISALGRIGHEQDSVLQRTTVLDMKRALLPYLDEPVVALRAQAVKALALLNDADTQRLLEHKKATETDLFVLGVYRKYLEATQ